MSTEVAGEQLLLAWSSSNLLGVSGMGPVAASPGWPLPPRDNFAGLGDAARYLADGAPLPPGSVPPVCLEFRPGPSQCLLLAKTYSTTSQRAGQYQVHAIRAGAGLSVWDLWALARSGKLVQEELSDCPTRLPSLSLTPARRMRVARDPDDVGELARLLQCLNEDRPYLVGTADQDRGVVAIQTLLSYLPIGLAREIPVSTFVPRATSWRSGVGLLIDPFSAPAVDLDLDLHVDPPRSIVASGAYLALADQLVTGGTDVPVGRVRSLADLRSLLALERSDLATVELGQVTHAVDTPLFDAVLTKLTEHPGCPEVMLRFIGDTGLDETLARRLREEGPQHADLVATLMRRFGQASSTPARRPLQAWLLAAVGPDQFADYVVPPLIAEARSEGVTVHSPELATLLADQLDVGDLSSFTFVSAPTRWGPVVEAEFEASLRAEGTMSAASRQLVSDQPARAATFLDSRLESGDLPAKAVAWALERCTDGDLPALVAVLVHSKAVPREYVVKALGARPEAVIRAILDAQWPRIAAQLGVPASVAGLLAVQRKSWWSGR
jgi:hypothetical protein